MNICNLIYKKKIFILNLKIIHNLFIYNHD